MNSSSKKRRVVITGMGAVSALGHTLENTWNGVLEGVSKAKHIERFDGSTFPSNFGYEVEDFSLEVGAALDRELEFMNEAAAYGVQACLEALRQAKLHQRGLDSNVDQNRVGVCLGVGMGGTDFDWFDQEYLDDQVKLESARSLFKHFPDQLSSIVGRIAEAKGGISTVHTACASSGQALGEAFENILLGEADVMVTGGADSMINPFYLAGFSLLGALSKRNDDPQTASRPFDEDRNGFVLGEGACILIFEEYEHALKRGAHIYGEVCGYGVTESAYRITDLHPDGRGPIEAMQMAVDDAGISPSQVGYINAHGTSTLLNDRIETLAVSKVFPDKKCDVHVSSTKSMTGHMIAAAGAMEFALCVKALECQILPPSVNLFEKGADIAAKLCPGTPTPKAIEYALSNSVGFGGSNTAVICKRV